MKLTLHTILNIVANHLYEEEEKVEEWLAEKVNRCIILDFDDDVWINPNSVGIRDREINAGKIIEYKEDYRGVWEMKISNGFSAEEDIEGYNEEDYEIDLIINLEEVDIEKYRIREGIRVTENISDTIEEKGIYRTTAREIFTAIAEDKVKGKRAREEWYKDRVSKCMPQVLEGGTVAVYWLDGINEVEQDMEFLSENYLLYREMKVFNTITKGHNIRWVLTSHKDKRAIMKWLRLYEEGKEDVEILDSRVLFKGKIIEVK